MSEEREFIFQNYPDCMQKKVRRQIMQKINTFSFHSDDDDHLFPVRVLSLRKLLLFHMANEKEREEVAL